MTTTEVELELAEVLEPRSFRILILFFIHFRIILLQVLYKKHKIDDWDFFPLQRLLLLYHQTMVNLIVRIM